MLCEAAAISGSITSSSLYAPWSEVESESSGRIIADLKSCFEKALDRRRIVKDTSEQWYALGAVRPSSGESSSQYSVHFSTVVEEGQVDFLPNAAPSRKVAGHSRHLCSPGKGKKCRGAQISCRVSSKFQVLQLVAKNVLRLMIPVLLLPWHLSVPTERHEKVGETEKLRQSFKE